MELVNLRFNSNSSSDLFNNRNLIINLGSNLNLKLFRVLEKSKSNKRDLNLNM